MERFERGRFSPSSLLLPPFCLLIHVDGIERSPCCVDVRVSGSLKPTWALLGKKKKTKKQINKNKSKEKAVAHIFCGPGGL